MDWKLTDPLLRKTKLVLASSDETVEAEVGYDHHDYDHDEYDQHYHDHHHHHHGQVVEQGRGELECPVCMEGMRPPRR